MTVLMESANLSVHGLKSLGRPEACIEGSDIFKAAYFLRTNLLWFL